MVCLGNICRSPMAEGILRSKLGDRAVIESAGTGGWHVGEQPDRRAQACMKGHGIDISGLRGRQFSQRDFDEFDRIFVMDESNYRDVLNMSRSSEDEEKVEMLLELTHPGQKLSVPDPYYGGKGGFEEVYNLIDEACERISKQYN